MKISVNGQWKTRRFSTLYKAQSDLKSQSHSHSDDSRAARQGTIKTNADIRGFSVFPQDTWTHKTEIWTHDYCQYCFYMLISAHSMKQIAAKLLLLYCFIFLVLWTFFCYLTNKAKWRFVLKQNNWILNIYFLITVFHLCLI